MEQRDRKYWNNKLNYINVSSYVAFTNSMMWCANKVKCKIFEEYAWLRKTCFTFRFRLVTYSIWMNFLLRKHSLVIITTSCLLSLIWDFGHFYSNVYSIKFITFLFFLLDSPRKVTFHFQTSSSSSFNICERFCCLINARDSDTFCWIPMSC